MHEANAVSSLNSGITTGQWESSPTRSRHSHPPESGRQQVTAGAILLATTITSKEAVAGSALTPSKALTVIVAIPAALPVTTTIPAALTVTVAVAASDVAASNVRAAFLSALYDRAGMQKKTERSLPFYRSRFRGSARDPLATQTNSRLSHHTAGVESSSDPAKLSMRRVRTSPQARCWVQRRSPAIS